MGKTPRLTSDDLRRLFLDFFREKDHPILPGSPLAPHDDPTLLFTTAGMVQFKPYYVATGAIPYRRAATVQPCFRASDLDSVGQTARHHTFFEMLGNFSFGDYFKEEAIAWAWEFSVDRLKLPEERIVVTVFDDDDEAEEIWVKKIGVDPRRVLRRGAKDNFWGPAGDSGPCGPCSELHLDIRDNPGGDYDFDAEGDGILEYWNLVFPQFDQSPDGERGPLPNRGIDTGMGLERLSLILQGAKTNYETDLFVPIVKTIRSFAAGDVDTHSGEGLVATRVIADHARALVFTVNEGILPGNEGRGYVLRRILRRALLRANRLGIEDLVMHRVAGAVVDRMEGAYPELTGNRERIVETIRAEEERFRKTLEQGLEIFRKVTHSLKKSGSNRIPGSDIFRLYDTYGFPVELTEEMAEGEGLTLDRTGFDESMEEQRTRSRWSVSSGDGADLDLGDLTSDFVGYDRTEGAADVTAIFAGGERVESIEPGVDSTVVLAESVFYGEAGGQIGDTGELISDDGELLFLVKDTTRGAEGQPLLHGTSVKVFSVGHTVNAKVDGPRREAIKKNHTATHLLHRALRDTLGDHVHQAGSLVAPDRLRFDFVHHSKTGAEEIDAIEQIVNHKIIDNDLVETREMAFDDAKDAGAMALFGEKYGERVRMVSVEEFSKELCGGTHVRSTGEIGPFLVTSESAVGSGVRRIEAITGNAAYESIREGRRVLGEVASRLKVPEGDTIARIAAMQDKIHALENELKAARQSVAGDQVGDLLGNAVLIGDVRLVAANLEGKTPADLKGIVDGFQKEKAPVVAVLGTDAGGKAFLVAGVNPPLVSRGIKAGIIIGKVAALLGGRGGGKPAFAQAGGGDVARLEEAIEAVPGIVSEMLGEGAE